MLRPTVAEVDLSALLDNARSLRSLLKPSVELMGMVKANAYGHGAVPVSQALATLGVTRFAVATLDEAMTLADSGAPGRVMLLGSYFADQAAEIAARGFEAVVSDMVFARCLSQAAIEQGRCVDVHLKFDTGMGRVGFRMEEAVRSAAAIADMKGLRIVGAMTHFASSDDPAATDFTCRQIETLKRIRRDLEALGIRIPLWHAANSAGLLWRPESHLDAVRPGIALYGGVPPLGKPCPIDLKQVMSLKTHIAQVRSLPEGRTVSYGRTFRIARPSRIAVLGIGYADGCNRLLSNKGQVLIRNRRAPIVGRVCMDTVMVDVTDIPEASPGDEAVLFGRQGDESLSFDAVARALGTIPHVLMTGISSRVPRVYVGGPG